MPTPAEVTAALKGWPDTISAWKVLCEAHTEAEKQGKLLARALNAMKRVLEGEFGPLTMSGDAPAFVAYKSAGVIGHQALSQVPPEWLQEGEDLETMGTDEILRGSRQSLEARKKEAGL